METSASSTPLLQNPDRPTHQISSNVPIRIHDQVQEDDVYSPSSIYSTDASSLESPSLLNRLRLSDTNFPPPFYFVLSGSSPKATTPSSPPSTNTIAVLDLENVTRVGRPSRPIASSSRREDRTDSLMEVINFYESYLLSSDADSGAGELGRVVEENEEEEKREEQQQEMGLESLRPPGQGTPLLSPEGGIRRRQRVPRNPPPQQQRSNVMANVALETVQSGMSSSSRAETLNRSAIPVLSAQPLTRTTTPRDLPKLVTVPAVASTNRALLGAHRPRAREAVSLVHLPAVADPPPPQVLQDGSVKRRGHIRGRSAPAVMAPIQFSFAPPSVPGSERTPYSYF